MSKSHSIPLPYKDQPLQTPLINLYDISKNISCNQFQSILNNSKREKLKELIEDVLIEQKKAEVNEISRNYQFENLNESNSSSLFCNSFSHSSDSNNLPNQNNKSVEYFNNNKLQKSSIILLENEKNEHDRKLDEKRSQLHKISDISVIQKEMIDLIEKGPSLVTNKETSLEELNEKDNFLTKNIDKNLLYLQNMLKSSKNDTSDRIKFSSKRLNNLIKHNSDINEQSQSFISNLNNIPKKLIRKLPVNSSLINQVSIEKSTSTLFKLDNIGDNLDVQPKKKLNLYSSLNYNKLKSLEKDSLERQINSQDEMNGHINENLSEESEAKKTNKESINKKSSKLINIDKILIKKTFEESDYMLGQNKSKFTCVECGMNVKKLSILKKHLLSHTHLKPFNCNICRRKFTTKGNLVKHLKTKAHINRCVCMGMSENDEKIMKISKENIDQSALNVQTEIKNKIRITRQ